MITISSRRPIRKLYDLPKDPAERHNLFAGNRAEAQALEDELATLITRYRPAPPTPPKGLSRERLELLESLGYVSAGPAAGSESSKIDPKDRLLEYRLYQRALHSLETGHLNDAIPTFREILDQDPHNTVARFHLGESFLAARRNYDALREWRTVLSYDPGYAPAAQALGEFWLARGDYPRARARLEQALAAAPDNPQTLLELGITEDHLGRRAEALAHVEAACKLGPSPVCDRVLRALQRKKK